MRDLTGDHRSAEQAIQEAKRYVVDHVLEAEISRLGRVAAPALVDVRPDLLRRALAALLVGMDRYRVYITPGQQASAEAESVLAAAGERAATELGDDEAAALLAGPGPPGGGPVAGVVDGGREAWRSSSPPGSRRPAVR